MPPAKRTPPAIELSTDADAEIEVVDALAVAPEDFVNVELSPAYQVVLDYCRANGIKAGYPVTRRAFGFPDQVVEELHTFVAARIPKKDYLALNKALSGCVRLTLG